MVVRGGSRSWVNYSPTGTDGLTDALVQMKAEGKPGVVFVAPADPNQANVLALEVVRLIYSKGSLRQRLSCETVLTWLNAEHAKTHFPDLKPEAAVLVLESDGKLIESLTNEEAFSEGSFSKRLQKSIHGKDDELLEARAVTQRTALGAEAAKIDPAIENLGAEQFQAREDASKELEKMAPRITAILVAEYTRTKDSEVKHRLTELFKSLYQAAAADKPGTKLPHGLSTLTPPTEQQMIFINGQQGVIME